MNELVIDVVENNAEISVVTFKTHEFKVLHFTEKSYHETWSQYYINQDMFEITVHLSGAEIKKILVWKFNSMALCVFGIDYVRSPDHCIITTESIYIYISTMQPVIISDGRIVKFKD